MLIDISGSPDKKRYNKDLILNRLIFVKTKTMMTSPITQSLFPRPYVGMQIWSHRFEADFSHKIA